ncbi:substrate-binding periplasmic protein [Fluviispira multicolorata]|uniref:substrate-binding periplasmic protein n=1 Tax=Fluviispira multicolorata TaxID=2654512 RepID=UPI001375814C|nr:transporter substrate-binding domain-containing protein [Fluviispira multicolorata]
MAKSLFYFLLIMALFQNHKKSNAKSAILFAENTPLTIKINENTVSGLAGDLFIEAIKLAKISNNFNISWTPWRRALFESTTKRNIFIVPIGDTEENKKKYNFIFKILSDNIYIITLKPTIEIKNPHDIKKLKSIGYIAGAPYEPIFKKYNFEKMIEPSNDGDYVVAKLLAKRVDGFLAAYENGIYKLRKAHVEKSRIQKGIPLGKINWYFGTNIKSTTEDINSLKNALNSLAKTPKYIEIYKKYGLTPPQN